MDEIKELITEPHKCCPFCGNDNIYIMTEQFYTDLYDDNGSATLTIECNLCGLVLYEHSVLERNYKYKRATLINKWNTRIGDK